MAYQNVGRPRFFIDNYQYLRTLGLDPQVYMENEIYLQKNNSQHKTIFDNVNAFNLDAVESKSFINTSSNKDYMKWYVPMGDQVANMDFSGNMKWYCALLNHDINAEIQGIQYRSAIEGELESADSFTSVLNGEQNLINSFGTSIFYTDNAPTEAMKYTGFGLKNTETPINEVNIGAISMGVMYTMPHSPNLNISMAVQNEGFNETNTAGGATLTNVTFTGAPTWTNKNKYINNFGVGDYSENKYLDGAKRNGRRAWTLRFSVISDRDLFSSNYMVNRYMEDDVSNYNENDYDSQNQFEYNMFTDDSFIAQVWNKTLGGALPFLFQADSNNNNPDQFCLAKFSMDTLKINQKAFKTYDISIDIVEIW